MPTRTIILQIFMLWPVLVQAQTSGQIERRKVPLKADAPLHFRVICWSDCRWTVGVHLAAGASAGLEATQLRFEQKPGAPMAQLTGGEEAGPGEAYLNGTVITLQPRPGHKLVVYVEVAKAVKLTIEAATRTELMVDKDLFVTQSSVFFEPLKGWHNLAALAALDEMSDFRGGRASTKPTAASTAHASGSGSLTWKDLGQHLVTKAALPQMAATKKPTMRLVKLTINSEGSIAQIEGIPAELAWEPVRNSILTWKFDPFIILGKATQVTGVIPLMVFESGKLSSPVLSCGQCMPATASR